MQTITRAGGAIVFGAVVVGAVLLTLSQPVIGVAVIVLLLSGLWAWHHPIAAASTLAFLTAAFPKAGVRVADFPFPVFLFGLILAVLIMWAKTPRAAHGPVTLLAVGAYLVFVTAKSAQFMGDGGASVFAFVAWAGLPIIMLAFSTSTTGFDPRFGRALQWGFLLSVAYACVQFVGGIETTAVPGLTYALGDDITEKHNVIYVESGENYSKIPSTYHNGNIYGMTAAVFLLYSTIRLLHRKGTKLDIAILVGATLAIGLSGSRTAILAAAIPVFVLLLGRGSFRWRFGIVAVTAVAAITVLTLQPDLARRYTIDAVLASGGAGRTTAWETTIASMQPLDYIFGMQSRAIVVDGWAGVLVQLGIVGVALLIVAVLTLMRRRPEWRVILLALLIGLVIDSTYITFPTWFIPAALFGLTLATDPRAPAPHPTQRRSGARARELVR
jgi:hypothetical protein